jgi:hypothetical protein
MLYYRESIRDTVIEGIARSVPVAGGGGPDRYVQDSRNARTRCRTVSTDREGQS